MMKYSVVLFFLLITLFTSSCEKDIQITPSSQSVQLVVDAQIENNSPPVVILSTSLNYFSTIDSTTLYNSFINNAKVFLSDGTKTIQLKNYEFKFANGYRYNFYSTDLSDPTHTILGVLGKTYQLTIDYNGALYNSETTIPLLTKQIDSLWYRPVPNRPLTDSFVVLSAKITDPPGLGNYIRFYTKINAKDFFPGFNSVFDDNVVDGKSYAVDLPKGIDKNNIEKGENNSFYKKGDTITVKFCNINKASYEFWRTWEYAYQSIGNPFSSPGVVIGNINNGALGAFCGYAAQYKKIIIPK